MGGNSVSSERTQYFPRKLKEFGESIAIGQNFEIHFTHKDFQERNGFWAMMRKTHIESIIVRQNIPDYATDYSAMNFRSGHVSCLVLSGSV